jgi:hypothetical protein
MIPLESEHRTTAILEPFTALAMASLLIFHSFVGPRRVTSRIKPEPGSIPKSLISESFTKRTTTLALIVDPDDAAILDGGDTRSGIQDDVELMQSSPVPTHFILARAGVLLQNISTTEMIYSELGDLRPR